MTSHTIAPRPLLHVQGLGVNFGRAGGDVCKDIGFHVCPGEIVAIVGESGSGKSITCRSLIGLQPEKASVRGSMTFADISFDLADRRSTATLRGRDISMIFQDPMSALDPLKTVRAHLALRTSKDLGALLRSAGLSAPNDILDAYPHQLSGGQCQRVSIACALAREPRLLIADEPTTALDVTVQAKILLQLRKLAEDNGTSVLLVSHDLAVVAGLCDRVMVMHEGRILEHGPATEVLRAPQKAYTRALINSIPTADKRGKRLLEDETHSPAEPLQSARSARSGLADTPLIEFRDIEVSYRRPDGRSVKAVDGVSLSVRPGEIFGLVGESGSGKSTLAKTAVGLARQSRGDVLLDGTALDWNHPQLAWRRRMQYIFQDPLGALNPTERLLSQVKAPLDIHRIGDRHGRAEKARVHMRDTRLDDGLFRAKPRNLSGGQRQRATIARALTLTPEVLICDESVSALDVTVQARVLDLLMDLRARHGIAILFISHDLGVIHHLCDRVAVMHQGKLVEQGDTVSVFNTPQHDYTRQLINAIPRPAQPEVAVFGGIGSAPNVGASA